MWCGHSERIAVNRSNALCASLSRSKHIFGRPTVSCRVYTAVSRHRDATSSWRHRARSHYLPPQPIHCGQSIIDHRPYIYRCWLASCAHTHDIANIAISEQRCSVTSACGPLSTAIRRHDARNREAPRWAGPPRPDLRATAGPQYRLRCRAPQLRRQLADISVLR